MSLYKHRIQNSRRPKQNIQQNHIRNVSAMKQAYFKHKKSSDGDQNVDHNTHRKVPSFKSQSSVSHLVPQLSTLQLYQSE